VWNARRKHGAGAIGCVIGGVVQISICWQKWMGGRTHDDVVGGMEMYIADEFGFGETGFELDWRVAG
jgi:hypothetical protein